MTEPDTLDATCSTCQDRGRGTYSLFGACLNCGWKGTVTYSEGHPADQVRCAVCGCKRVAAVLPGPDDRTTERSTA